MSNRWPYFLFIIVLLLLVVFASLLYFQWGGKYYFRAIGVIEKTLPENKSKSLSIFNIKTPNNYSGIIMGVFTKFIPGVWVWGEKGPRFFRSDENTVYSLFQMCTPEIMGDIKSGKNISPTRILETEIKVWAKNVSVGDFIIVRVVGQEEGKDSGNLREALAYDWWIFDTGVTTIEKLCEQ